MNEMYRNATKEKMKMATLKEMLEASLTKKTAPQITLDRREKVCQIGEMYTNLDVKMINQLKTKIPRKFIDAAQKFAAQMNPTTMKEIEGLTIQIQKFIETHRDCGCKLADTNFPENFAFVVATLTDAELDAWYNFENIAFAEMSK